MTYISKALAISLIACAVTACSDSSLTQTGDNSPLASKNSVPVQQSAYENTLDITSENQNKMYLEAIDLFLNGDIEQSYPIFVAVEKRGIKAANVYLGTIEGAVGPYYAPKKAVARHYDALEDAPHASSIVTLARAYKTGEILTQDMIGAAQYYARILNTNSDKNHPVVIEAEEFFATTDIEVVAAAKEREENYLRSVNLPARGNLYDLSKSVSEHKQTYQAPGTNFNR